MADPIIGDHYRVMAVFDHKGGLPRDAVVNTFVFRNDSPGRDTFEEQVAQLLDNFYYEPVTGTGQYIGQYLSKNYNRPYYKTYDLGQAPPREPGILQGPNENVTHGQGVTLPSEVAACITWMSDVVPPKPKVLGKRGRGRTYIGPLNTSALADQTNYGAVLASQFQQTLAEAAQRLVETGWPTDLGLNDWPALVVLSQQYAQTDVVTRGYVDNAFDTQRRRGTDPTNRWTFTKDEVGPQPS